MAETLRPRGMCLFQETDLKPYNFDKQLIMKDDSAYTAVPNFFNVVSTAIRRRRGQLDAPLMFGWAEAHPSLEDVHREDSWMPIGVWYNPPGAFLSNRILYIYILNLC